MALAFTDEEWTGLIVVEALTLTLSQRERGPLLAPGLSR